uniref:Kinesin motor domain-containing protein n=1 Tax=Caenorhabditis tropicalis TaxID=1561998 RepID=A0A1I7T1X3_9PELO
MASIQTDGQAGRQNFVCMRASTETETSKSILFRCQNITGSEDTGTNIKARHPQILDTSEIQFLSRFSASKPHFHRPPGEV